MQKRKAPKRQSIKRREQAIQKAVAELLDTAGRPGLVWFHVPNGGARSPVEAAIFKGLGVKPGVPDIFAFYQSALYVLELKTEDGTLSDDQRIMLEQLAAAGAHTAVAYGVDQAITVLKSWGLVRVHDSRPTSIAEAAE
jgi:hypothetical protein